MSMATSESSTRKTNKMDGFLESLIDSSPETSSKSIKNHLARLDNEITRVQTQIQSTIKSSWSEFQHQSITGSSLYHQSLNLENQLNQIDERLDDPQNGLVPRLLSAVKYHQEISAEYSTSSQNLKAIQSLSTAYQQLSILSKSIYSEDLVTAVSILPKTKSEVGLLKQLQSASSLTKRAAHRIQELEEDLKQRLVDDVRSCVTLQDIPEQPEHSVFKFNLLVNARTPQQARSLIQWSLAVEALQALSGPDFINAQFKKIANLLIDNIITPLIDPIINTSTHLKLNLAETLDKSHCLLTFEKQADENWLDLYDSFRLLFSTLQDKLLTKPLQEKFSQHLTPPLETKLLSEALDSGLPNSPRDEIRLRQLTELLDQTRLFGNWLEDHDWLSNSPKNGLLEWCDNVQDRFLHKVATRVLESARIEMVNTQWESVTVPWEVVPEVENLPPPRQENATGQEPSPVTHHPPYNTTTVPTASHELCESPQPAAGFRSLFNLVSSNSHHTQPSPNTTPSKLSSQRPTSPISPVSKNFRSLFNFGTERENLPNPETSEEPSSSATDKTSSPEIIDHISESSSSPPENTNEPSSPPSNSQPLTPSTNQNKLEEDVDWDMSGELLADPEPFVPLASSSSNSHIPALEETVDEEIEEDAWGLDESNEQPISAAQLPEDNALINTGTTIVEYTPSPTKQTTPLPKKVDDEAEEEDPDPDAWGFEQEEATSATTSTDEDEDVKGDDEVMRLRGGLPSPVSSEVDDDGWGWTDDLPVEAPIPQENDSSIADKTDTDNLGNPPSSISGQEARIEHLTISTLAQRVLEIVNEVVEDAVETEKPDFPSPSLSQSGTGLIKLGLDVIDLFRIVMIVQHSKLLDSVTSLSVQFSNDCDWLAKQIQLIPRLNQLEETRKLSEKLKALGVTVREKQLANQRTALMECLNEAEGFVETSREDRFSACERACKQVTHTLASLAQVWKPVMLRTEYLKSLGSLVEAVLRRILNEIEEQIDIEENDSKQLNSICKSLHSLINLFDLQPDFDHADIYRYVPSWFKFCFLSELLEASMAEIMWMYHEGHLSEFSQQEIIGLIKALFADSHLRAKNIDLILSSNH
ncbi:hypothetical protein KEM48_011440 [Puccinia striiformis f. sp. tritici PST-130]|nr:hypothetical protein Pst134EB_006518 [Puccinia striiformis f. sp. tritici]KAI9628756.1 hypothetical protein KEM48_011440 [Puccinia striiformis f. sp. tritici PST-130]